MERDHADVLATVDAARTRIVTVESLYGQLGGLSQDQRSFLTLAIEAARHGIYRAAVIMAWAAVVDRLQYIHDDDGYAQLGAKRKKWSVVSVEDLREQVPDYQLIDATRDTGFVNKAQAKTLHGMLNARNRAAHPGPFNESLNSTLGYLEDVLSELGALVGKP